MNSVNDLEKRLDAEAVKLRKAQQKIEELKNSLEKVKTAVNKYEALADKDRKKLTTVNNQREQEILFDSLRKNDRMSQDYSRNFYEIRSEIQKEENNLQAIKQKITSNL